MIDSDLGMVIERCWLTPRTVRPRGRMLAARGRMGADWSCHV